MQKDEEDILQDWIIYHAYLFGLNNLHIIDNHSGQPSKKILEYYRLQGLNVYTRSDYTKKGDYICELIKANSDHCDLAIPLDLDEFIGGLSLKMKSEEQLIEFAKKCLCFDPNFYLNHYSDLRINGKITQQMAFVHFIRHGYLDGRLPCQSEKMINYTDSECLLYLEKNQYMIFKNHPEWFITCDKEDILKMINNLPIYGRYAFSFYMTSRNSQLEYSQPIEEIVCFDQVDLEDYQGKGNYNKKFFQTKSIVKLDHGHHYGQVENLTQFECLNAPLFLFHFHHRGIKKLVEKCMNDIQGFGFVKNIENQQELKEKLKLGVPGAHNIETYLNYLTKGPYSLFMYENEGIKINILSKKISSLKSLTDKLFENN
jgi:hypothetical protein